jgi:single-strand DNA-binding protein
MINDALVTFCGYVATDPTFRKTETGISFAKLRIAFTERKRDRETGEWSDGPTTFLGVQCWRTLAENVARSLRKGEPVMVRGRLFTRYFKDGQGEERSVLEVEASALGHDLARGVSNFSRTRNAPGATAAELAAAAAAGAGPADGDGADGSSADGSSAGISVDGSPAVVSADGTAAGATGGTAAAQADGDGETAGSPGAGPLAAGAIVDENAVAEFARELGESLAAEPEPSPV